MLARCRAVTLPFLNLSMKDLTRVSETPSAAPDQDVTQSTAEPVVEALGRLFDEPITQLPEDLYIPPEALRVFLEAFEGPLDLLLYLIRRQIWIF